MSALFNGDETDLKQKRKKKLPPKVHKWRNSCEMNRSDRKKEELEKNAEEYANLGE